ncbi:MAG: hypothetical protein AAF580_01885 [Pseudomonadota bacterium]
MSTKEGVRRVASLAAVAPHPFPRRLVMLGGTKFHVVLGGTTFHLMLGGTTVEE